jgi:very-short-patch-repair endonuclease
MFVPQISPIEDLFYTAYNELDHPYKQLVRQRPVPRQNGKLFFADFAHEHARVIIEIDGHQWHTGRKQQMYDAWRQKYLESLGWRVIRFTGSEVWHDPEGCAQKAVHAINEGVYLHMTYTFEYDN